MPRCILSILLLIFVLTGCANLNIQSFHELEEITPQNVDRLSEVARLGRGDVLGLAISPDNNTIAVGTTTGIYFYERNTGKLIDFLNRPIGTDMHPSECDTQEQNIDFSPDGKILAIGDENIELWDWKNKKLEQILYENLRYPDSRIRRIEFNQDGQRLVAIRSNKQEYPCISGGNLGVYNVQTGAKIFHQDIQQYKGINGDFYVTNQDTVNFFALINYQTESILVDAKSGIPVQGNDSPVFASDIWEKDLRNFRIKTPLPHSQKFLALSEITRNWVVLDNQAKVLCEFSNSLEKMSGFETLAFSKDGSLLVVWEWREARITVWDMLNCTISDILDIFPVADREIKISPDGKFLLTGSRAGFYFYLWELETGKYHSMIRDTDSVIFDISGKRALVSNPRFRSSENAMKIIDIETGRVVNTVYWDKAEDWTREVLLSPDGHTLIRNRKYVSDLSKDGKTIMELPYLTRLQFNMDGTRLAGLTRDTFRVWDTTTWNELPEQQITFPINIPPYFSVISPNWSWVATENEQRYLTLWELNNLRPIQTELAYASEVTFSPNEQLVIYDFLDENPRVEILNTGTGDIIQQIRIPLGMFARSVTISPDGRLIAILHKDGTIRLWGVRMNRPTW